MSTERSIRVEVEVRQCRICLGGDDEEKRLEKEGEQSPKLKNPLLRPCECSGSASYIHLDCIREWLNSKRVKRTSIISTNYVFKVAKCELCQTNYPDEIELHGHQYSLFQFEVPENCHYLVIEVLGMPVGKNIQVVSIPGNYISIGRDEESDLRVCDISVSRYNSLIRFDRGLNEIVLQDNGSKFGTLMLLQRPIELKVN